MLQYFNGSLLLLFQVKFVKFFVGDNRQRIVILSYWKIEDSSNSKGLVDSCGDIKDIARKRK